MHQQSLKAVYHSSTHFCAPKKSLPWRRTATNERDQRVWDKGKKIIVIYLAIAQSLASCYTHTHTHIDTHYAHVCLLQLRFVHIFPSLTLPSLLLLLLLLTFFQYTVVIGFNCYCSSSRLSQIRFATKIWGGEGGGLRSMFVFIILQW